MESVDLSATEKKTSKQLGDEYEQACHDEIYRHLQEGRQLVVDYLNASVGHLINAPAELRGKRDYDGGRSGRKIEVDLSMVFRLWREGRDQFAAIECKNHQGNLDVDSMAKFAYDLLDLRDHDDTKDAVGIIFGRHNCAPGAKKIAAAERIAVALFDHEAPGSRMACLLEETLPWLEQPVEGFTGDFYFEGNRWGFSSPAEFLVHMGEALAWPPVAKSSLE